MADATPAKSDVSAARTRYLKRWGALKKERSSWDDHWKDIAAFISPRRSRFFQSDRNDGKKKHQSIVNGAPKRASRVLSSGIMAGVTSPARPWFRLGTADKALMESYAVSAWLDDVAELIRQTFASSNIYNALHTGYRDLGDFGTTAIFIDEDPEDVLRGYVLPIGQYALGNSARLQVDTLYRELSMSVGQLVERFGLEACSVGVQQFYKRGEIDQWVEVLHVVEPNRDFANGRTGAAGMRWKSCWMEQGKNDPRTGFLRESGYNEFPVLCPRWEVAGEDIYGSSPGMDALGDAKALQQYEKRKAQAVELLVRPPMVGPSTLRNQRASLVPGDTTYVDVASGGQTFAAAITVNPAGVVAMGEAVGEHRQRVNEAYYADLWLMLTEGDQGEMTAREVVERHQEKMLQLGPVMTRLEDELLNPLIDRVFGILLRSGRIPEAPPELQGVTVKVEYISVMAQAQKLLATTGLERVSQFALTFSQSAPEILDNLDVDKTFRSYADAVGISPDNLRDAEAVAAIRQRRAQEQQAAKQGEAMLAAAKGAKDLSGASLENDSALSRLMSNLGGVAGGSVAPGGVQ